MVENSDQSQQQNLGLNSTAASAAGGGEAVEGQVQLTFPLSKVALIRMGAPSERVVTLTPSRMQSLDVALKQVEESAVVGLVIAGSQPGMFTVGADVKLIQGVNSAAEGRELAAEGQRVFDRLAALKAKTVVAISGPCVGGGYELALACDLRLMSSEGSGSVGLPEVKLGIMPGFGGTQRLPRLIGLPRALEFILSGRTFKAEEALAQGLVDLLLTEEQLLEKAIHLAGGGQLAGSAGLVNRVRPDLMDHSRWKGVLPWGSTGLGFSYKDKLLTFTAPGRSFVVKQARAGAAKKGGKNYPALDAAIDATAYGLEAGLAAGLKREAELLGELVVSPSCKGLVHLFFASEAAKSLGKAVGSKGGLNAHALVVGAGVMGAGIAAELARAGATVVLKDVKGELLERAKGQIKKVFEGRRSLSARQRTEAFQRVEFSVTGGESLGNTTLVVEAVFEDLTVKQQVLSEIASVVPTAAVICSNTSAIPITTLAEKVSHPERFVGLHFFNPVEKMPLVEVVRGRDTDDRTLLRAANCVSALGKFPIIVSDVPGFLVNRVLTPFLNESLWLLSEGVDPILIEKAAKQFGMPMGPLRLLDEVGLDVAHQVAKTLRESYGERYETPDLVRPILAEGLKGKKSGKGFYTFEGDKPELSKETLKIAGVTVRESQPQLEVVTDRLILPMVNESIRCLDEGVAGAAGAEAAFQVDLGSVMGFGFPAFRGGILFYAESFGWARLQSTLSDLAKSAGKRFEPAPGIAARVK